MVKKIVLKNGLRILLVPQASSVAATVLVLVEAGSEYESKDKSGISHFLEHLVFKGTTKRPEAGMISTELDSLGARSNAFTGQEYTGYWAKVHKGRLDKALEIVSDLYLNPIFNAEEIEKERGVVIEEINMYEDMPMRQVHEVFGSLMYGDQPAGWGIAGEKDVIRILKRDDFIKYRAEHYVAPATVVVVAGNFREKEVLANIKKYFGELKRAKKGVKSKTVEKQTKPALRVQYKKSDQAHLVLGVRAFPVFDKRRHALQLLGDVLGGGMSSRLFKRLREDLGLAYYVHSDAELFLDHGYFAIASGVDPKRIEMAIEAIIFELRRMKDELVPKAELEKAKEHLTGSLLLGLETSDDLASFYGGQEIIAKKLVEPEVLIKKIKSLKAEDLRKVAREVLVTQYLNLAIIGPYEESRVFEKLLVI